MIPTAAGRQLVLLCGPVLLLSVQQVCPAYLSSSSVQQCCPAVLFSRSVQQICPAVLSSNSAKPLCLAALSSRSVQQACSAGLSSSSVQQLCPAGLSSSCLPGTVFRFLLSMAQQRIVQQTSAHRERSAGQYTAVMVICAVLSLHAMRTQPNPFRLSMATRPGHV